MAHLWQRCFRHSQEPPSPALLAHFQEVFFDNPWREEGLWSLVYEDGSGQVIGFIGVVPRRMIFRKQRIRVAVATQLMVDPARGNPFAAMEMVRRLFAGPQDLTFSDGANRLSERLWPACGGECARLYCLEWMRVLRTAESVAMRFGRHPKWGMAARLAKPFCRAADAAASALGVSPHCPARPAGVSVEAARPEVILSCLDRFAASTPLRPEYDLESLQWLLDQASRSRRLGELRSLLVRDSRGHVTGWFIYYVKPGEAAHVLQLVAHPSTIGPVLDGLFHDAWQCGASSISGQMEPRFIEDLCDRRCRLSCPGFGVLVHSRNQDLLSTIHHGDAILTRLDGEWWLRLGIDRHLKW